MRNFVIEYFPYVVATIALILFPVFIDSNRNIGAISFLVSVYLLGYCSGRDAPWADWIIKRIFVEDKS